MGKSRRKYLLLVGLMLGAGLAIVIAGGTLDSDPRLAFDWQTGPQIAVPTPATPAQAQGRQAVTRSNDLELLARVIAAEAQGEPYAGKVAVGAVIMNRVRDAGFPNTLSGVIYQPHAFESVTNGLVWRRSPSSDARRAAQEAVNGWDPSYGSLFFWNPYKPVSPWIWTRNIIVQYGQHVFGI